MKYLHRQPPATAGRTEVEGRIRNDMALLMAKEQAVLEAWAAQRRSFEDCVKFVTVEVSPLSLLTSLAHHVSLPHPGSERLASLLVGVRACRKTGPGAVFCVSWVAKHCFTSQTWNSLFAALLGRFM